MNVCVVIKKENIKSMLTMITSLVHNQKDNIDIYAGFNDIDNVVKEQICQYICGLSSLEKSVNIIEVCENLEGELDIEYLPNNIDRIICLQDNVIIKGSIDELYNIEQNGLIKLSLDIQDELGIAVERFDIAEDGLIDIYRQSGYCVINLEALRRANYTINDEDIVIVDSLKYSLVPHQYIVSADEVDNNITDKLLSDAHIIRYPRAVYKGIDYRPWVASDRDVDMYSFDKLYWEYEDIAIDGYNSLGQDRLISSRPFLLYYGDKCCYNILNHMTDQIKKAMHRRGIATYSFSEYDNGIGNIVRYTDIKLAGIYGVQMYLYSMYLKETGDYFHNLIDAPKYNMILDHPVWMKAMLDINLKDYHIITHDNNYRRFIYEYYRGVSSVNVIPPGVDDIIIDDEPDYNNRIYDVAFVGTYNNYRDKYAMLAECDENTAVLGKDFYEMMLSRPDMTAEAALKMVCRKHGIDVDSDTFFDILTKMAPMVQCVMFYYREKVIESIVRAGIRIHVWGDSWKDAHFSGAENLIIHEELSPENSMSVYSKAKLSLNIMAWHKGGFTERIVNSMAAGAVVVTDITSYDDGVLDSNSDIVMFDLTKLDNMPDMINKLLEDDEYRISIAKAGREYAVNTASWDRRLDDMLKIRRDDL